ncbi:MAG: hypothetical protein KA369_23090 [Spirochaetes bacterium]|nr:hypothetical protein [Spirochaetota bacterium]
MNEILVMTFCIIGLIIILYLHKKRYIPFMPLLLTAYCCITASNIFSVIEGFLLYNVFNLLEHLSYLAGGFFMLAGIIHYRKQEIPWNRS